MSGERTTTGGGGGGGRVRGGGGAGAGGKLDARRGGGSVSFSRMAFAREWISRSTIVTSRMAPPSCSS